ncbi:hypothetical protein Barb6_03829 [Bacteroidales bacterium Barb6]|nr:hypothetical protein Barb6_03829 [Bacteroidales bacterium Barb6]
MPRNGNSLTKGYLPHNCNRVERLYHFQKLIGGITLVPDNLRRRISQTDTLFPAKGNGFLLIKCLLISQEIVSVAIENKTENPPHIICDIRIVEIHRPTWFGWRETAQHQELRLFRKKETEGMLFNLPVHVNPACSSWIPACCLLRLKVPPYKQSP